MSVALLANENFPMPAIRKLRIAGIDVVAVRETMPSASDREVMAYARREGRWIVTFDRNYGDLVFREGLLPPPAILFFRQAPYAPEHPADLALALLSEPHLAEGCMVVVGERSIRRKHFPRGRCLTIPPISLSALQHWSYCPRQCALIHVEQAFEQNVHTQRDALFAPEE